MVNETNDVVTNLKEKITSQEKQLLYKVNNNKEKEKALEEK